MKETVTQPGQPAEYEIVLHYNQREYTTGIKAETPEVAVQRFADAIQAAAK